MLIRAALAAYWGWFLIPLLLASLARPFALGDSFSSVGIRVVEGELWLLYLARWAVLGLSVWTMCELLRRRGCDWIVRAAAAGVLLMHGARFAMTLHVTNGWMEVAMIAAFYLGAMALGLGLQWLPRGRTVVAGMLVVLYPLFTAGGVYRQELTNQRQLFAVSTVLGEMDSQARAGYSLAMTGWNGDFEGTELQTVHQYFFSYGPLWYGLDAARALVVVRDKGWPEHKFTVMSLFDPGRLEREAKLDMRRVEEAYVMVPGDFGTFGRLADLYGRLPFSGAENQPTRHVYLYIVGDAKDAGRVHWTLQEMPAGRKPGGF
jgi:hypothetical protein